MNRCPYTFRRLLIWQKSKRLALEIYRLTQQFPREELYGMTSQLRRASTSVGANIAEGNERRTLRERVRFFEVAKGSLVEVDWYLEIAFELDYLSERDYRKTLDLINTTAYILKKFIFSQREHS